MNRLLCAVSLVGSMAATAAAQKAPAPTAALPVVGEQLTVNGASWAKHDWMYDAPNEKDAAGKILVHWFCGPKVKTCADDLARIVTLKEAGRVYIVAHIDGNKAQAKKLDPIRESEGVGQGTVGFGKGATTLMKQMGVTGPASVVVNVDGKVALVTTGSTPAELDERDKKVAELGAAIKAYALTVGETPKAVKPGDKFTLGLSIKLSPWLTYSATAPRELKFTVPPDFKCDTKELKGEQLKIEGLALTGSITCTAPKGSYEARADLRFGFTTPTNGSGLGTESGKWKFEVKP